MKTLIAAALLALSFHAVAQTPPAAPLPATAPLPPSAPAAAPPAPSPAQIYEVRVVRTQAGRPIVLAHAVLDNLPAGQAVVLGRQHPFAATVGTGKKAEESRGQVFQGVRMTPLSSAPGRAPGALEIEVIDQSTTPIENLRAGAKIEGHPVVPVYFVAGIALLPTAVGQGDVLHIDEQTWAEILRRDSAVAPK